MEIDKNVTKKDKTAAVRELIYGLKTPIDLEGKIVPAINLDNGATTPPFKDVMKEIDKQLLMYGSIGRGTGQKSEYTSRLYASGREEVMKFVGVDSKDEEKYTVFYVNSTTDGLNKLASALVKSHRDRILTTRMEHHANDLPWRERGRTVYTEIDELGRLDINHMERLLEKYSGQENKEKIKLVAVTAASNVTGYVNDVHKIASLAHKYGAQIVVDGAQIVAHREFKMSGNNEDDSIDFFVFSAHKMYSPYGGGVVVGLKDVLNANIPVFYGGGMVDKVTDNAVIYTDGPDLYEAGSPNYPGVIGMLKAMEVLKEKIGFKYIEEHEQLLLRKTLNALKEIPNVLLYGDSENITDRIGSLVFNIRGFDSDVVAKYLAKHSAIAVRHAKFCAHTYVDRLLGKVDYTDAACVHTGMVRISFGCYTDEEEIGKLIIAIKDMLEDDSDNITKFSRTFTTNIKLPNDRG